MNHKDQAAWDEMNDLIAERDQALELYHAAAEECRASRQVSKYTAVVWTERQTKHNELREKAGMDPL